MARTKTQRPEDRSGEAPARYASAEERRGKGRAIRDKAPRASQNRRDYRAFVQAIRTKRINAIVET